MNDRTRNAWITRMVELMNEVNTAGCDPYEVLLHAAELGYTDDDLVAVASRYEKQVELLTEDAIQTAVTRLLMGAESYLKAFYPAEDA